MANGADIAKAYVQIIPSTDGIKGSLENLMGGEAQKAGTSSGNKFSKFFGGALKAGGAAIAGAAAGATALTGSIIAGASATAEYGDQVDKMSQKLGLSTQAYQQWDYVLGQSGADITSMSTGMKTLTNKLDDAKNGGEAAQEMFAALGLSMEDLSTMSREDVFAATIAGFQGMADSTERAALANDLFGRSGQELTPLFNTSVEETQALMQAASDLGMVMSDEAVSAAADYQDALDTLQRTFGGLKNSLMGDFMPSITSVMDGLSALISGDSSGIGKISEGITSFIDNLTSMAPQLLEVGSSLILSLGEAIVSNLPLLLSAANETILSLSMGLTEQLPMILQVGLQVLVELANGIASALPTLIPTAVSVIVEMVRILTDPANISNLIDAAIAIIFGLADGIIDALPILIEAVPEILINLTTALISESPKLLEASVMLVVKLVEGIISNLPKLLASGKDMVVTLVTGAWSLAQQMYTKAGELIGKFVSGFIQKFPEILAKGKELVGKVIDGIKTGTQAMLSIGKNLVQGLWSGISSSLGWIKDRISGWVGNVMSFIKRLFKIGSPSKVMADEVGVWLARGIGVGFEDGMDDVTKDMATALPTMSMTLGSSALAGPAYHYGGVTIQIMGREKDAEQLAVELQAALVRRTAVWA